MSLTILADENIPAVDHYLGSLGTVRRAGGRNLQRSQLEGVDVLLVRSVTRVDEALLRGSAVKFVGTATSGVDHIDQVYLQQQGIGFSHAPGSNANSVVEYVLTAIAGVAGKLEQLLLGGTVGIVGYGVIGKAVAARFQALGIDYRVYDPWLEQGDINNPASLCQVLACDVVTLHCELTRAQPWPSFHLLGEPELKSLGSRCLLINASRGPAVDNRALLARLLQDDGPATVLDVWEGEPQIDQALLREVLIGTPHIAGYSLDGKLLATRMLAEAISAQLDLPLPPQNSPAGDPQALTITDTRTHTGAGLVRAMLQARYDIATDDALLRGATLARDAGSAAAAFDGLRKAYGERRELLGSTVRCDFRSPGDIELVQGLGCLPAPQKG